MTRALIERGNRVYLVQRRADAAQMAGMWELPVCEMQRAGSDADCEPEDICIVRHSITNTDYKVRVVSQGLKALDAMSKKAGRWVGREQIFELPLTGLTRKILRKTSAARLSRSTR
jgi:adenine-specific DNA glycosylase